MKISSKILSAALVGVVSTLAAGLPVRAADAPEGSEKAVLAAGCFWCLEAIFEQQPGVSNVVSGFAGGEQPNPTYEGVSHENTGHAESIEITYDPTKTSFGKLLDLYWRTFDATEGRGVAPDFGPSYRPIIFYANPEQQKEALASKKAEAEKLGKAVATEIQPLTKFWPADAYHQDFVKRNPNQGYVRSVSYERMDRVGAKHQ